MWPTVVVDLTRILMSQPVNPILKRSQTVHVRTHNRGKTMFDTNVMEHSGPLNEIWPY